MAAPGVKIIRPDTADMGLLASNPALMYGFHGEGTVKSVHLAETHQIANRSGELSRGKKLFYFIDYEFQAPDSVDEKALLNQLHLKDLPKVPFIVVKRLTLDCTHHLGQLWYEWAIQAYGRKAVESQEVDWENAISYMQTYPDLAEYLFEMYPKLRCVVMPVKMVNSGKTAWVGVTLRRNAYKWVSHAEVRFKPEIEVNLKF
jgi:hypothetical protein